MNNKAKNPFVDLVLDPEELAIEQALAEGEFNEAPNFADTKKMLELAAENYQKLHTSKPVTIRINQLDLIKVKAKAKRSNVPYQTLLGSLIHQFADDEKKLAF